MPVAWKPWVDSLTEREVLRLRARYELSLDELRGMYISDAQVDALLRERDEGDDRIEVLDAHRARSLAPELARAGAPAALKHRLGFA